jgi:DNA-directed RNA polymerase I subunit RPA49
MLLLQDFRDRRNDLGQTFGTKKSKKAISSIAENSINQGKQSTNADKPMKLNAAELAILDSMADAVKNVPLRNELTAMVTASKPRPEANHQTMDPQEVYKAEKVVGVDTMKLIPVRQWMESMKAKKEIRTSSRYVAHRMQSHVQNTEKLKVLRYMLLLLDFYNSSRPSRGGRTIPKREDLKNILGDMPEAVLEGVKRKFTEGGLMNKAKSDSLIMYLCALACIVDNAIVNIWDLKEDLKLETKEMMQYFTEVGAKISALSDVERKRLGLEKAAAAQRKVAKIKCPLEYPKVSGGRKNRK